MCNISERRIACSIGSLVHDVMNSTAIGMLAGDPDLALAASTDYASIMLSLILSLGSCILGTALFCFVFVPLWVSWVTAEKRSGGCVAHNNVHAGFLYFSMLAVFIPRVLFLFSSGAAKSNKIVTQMQDT